MPSRSSRTSTRETSAVSTSRASDPAIPHSRRGSTSKGLDQSTSATSVSPSVTSVRNMARHASSASFSSSSVHSDASDASRNTYSAFKRHMVRVTDKDVAYWSKRASSTSSASSSVFGDLAKLPKIPDPNRLYEQLVGMHPDVRKMVDLMRKYLQIPDSLQGSYIAYANHIKEGVLSIRNSLHKLPKHMRTAMCEEYRHHQKGFSLIAKLLPTFEKYDQQICVAREGLFVRQDAAYLEEIGKLVSKVRGHLRALEDCDLIQDILASEDPDNW